MMELIKKRLELLRGESGAAFLLALLVLGSVMIFATFLLSHTQTASSQANTTSDRIEARLMAEAGIDYYGVLLEEAVLNTATHDAMDVALPENTIRELSDTHRFEISEVKSSLNGEKLIVSFVSTGIVGERSFPIEHETVIAP